MGMKLCCWLLCSVFAAQSFASTVVTMPARPAVRRQPETSPQKPRQGTPLPGGIRTGSIDEPSSSSNWDSLFFGGGPRPGSTPVDTTVFTDRQGSSCRLKHLGSGQYFLELFQVESKIYSQKLSADGRTSGESTEMIVNEKTIEEAEVELKRLGVGFDVVRRKEPGRWAKYWHKEESAFKVPFAAQLAEFDTKEILLEGSFAACFQWVRFLDPHTYFNIEFSHYDTDPGEFPSETNRRMGLVVIKTIRESLIK